GFQQRVETLARDHVGLVDDIDPEAALDRQIANVVRELADRVDPTVRGAVYLGDVHGPRVADLLAVRALVARFRRGPGRALTVQGLGEQAGSRRFADAADAREQECVGDTSADDGVPQGLGYVLLADQIAELLRPILAGEDQIVPFGSVGSHRAMRGSPSMIAR